MRLLPVSAASGAFLGACWTATFVAAELFFVVAGTVVGTLGGLMCATVLAVVRRRSAQRLPFWLVGGAAAAATAALLPGALNEQASLAGVLAVAVPAAAGAAYWQNWVRRPLFGPPVPGLPVDGSQRCRHPGVYTGTAASNRL